MSKKIIILFIVVLVGGLIATISTQKEEKNISGGVVVDLAVEKTKTLTLDNVVLDEYTLKNNENQLIKIDLYNQMKKKGVITEMNCKGKVLIDCINSEVDNRLKEYGISTINVSQGKTLKTFNVSLNKVQ